MKFYYSDEGQKIFAEHLHYTLPISLSEGEIDKSEWNGFEIAMDDVFQNAGTCVSQYIKNRHDIFINGGAKPYASYNFVVLFCAANAADRVTADEAWDEIVKKIDNGYKGWLSNIE